MAEKKRFKQQHWEIKRQRVKYKLRRSSNLPRLVVYRSNMHMYVQLVDDSKGITLTSASTIDRDLRETVANLNGKIEKSKIVGRAIAEKAIAKGVEAVVFDRNGYKYHGNVKALAEAAREAGLKF